MPQQRYTTTSSRPRTGKDAVERLYVYWLFSTIFLCILIVAMTLVSRGALNRYSESLAEIATAIEQLDERLTQLESTPRTAPSVRARPEASSSADEPAAAERQPAPPTRQDADQSQPNTQIPLEDAVRDALRRVAIENPRRPADIHDREGAQRIIKAGLEHVRQADWSGETWARLAVLARLLGRQASAEAFAMRAAELNAPLTDYTEATAREWLVRDRAPDALPLLQELAQNNPESPRFAVLLADALLQSGQLGAADATLAQIADPSSLDVPDLLTLGRCLVKLQRWDSLDAVLTQDEVPDAYKPEHSFLQAISLLNSGRTVAALAVLDYLAAGNNQAPSRGDGWPVPHPDTYEIEVWRGVTLFKAEQYESARETLASAAAQAPKRALAHHYLGLLAITTGSPDEAINHLQNAVARDARLAMSWETLGLMAINRDALDEAMGHLERALAANPRRASAHFAKAIVHAKRSEAEPAAASLQRAFLLDPRYITEAEQTEVITRLFTIDELEQLADAAANPAP